MHVFHCSLVKLLLRCPIPLHAVAMVVGDLKDAAALSPSGLASSPGCDPTNHLNRRCTAAWGLDRASLPSEELDRVSVGVLASCVQQGTLKSILRISCLPCLNCRFKAALQTMESSACTCCTCSWIDSLLLFRIVHVEVNIATCHNLWTPAHVHASQ